MLCQKPIDSRRLSAMGSCESSSVEAVGLGRERPPATRKVPESLLSRTNRDVFGPKRLNAHWTAMSKAHFFASFGSSSPWIVSYFRSVISQLPRIDHGGSKHATFDWLNEIPAGQERPAVLQKLADQRSFDDLAMGRASPDLWPQRPSAAG